MLAKNPGFTAVVVLTLALGIGANTAIFSLIDAVMFPSLSIQAPQQLVVLEWSARRGPRASTSWWLGCPIQVANLTGCSFSQPMLEQFRAANVFSGVFAFAPPEQLGVSIGGHASLADGELVSGDFFPTLGVRAAWGRMLGISDDTPGAPSVVVLSYNYWQRQFGGQPKAVEQSILLDGISFTVVGVTAKDFAGLDAGILPDLWVPLSSPIREKQDRPKGSDVAAWWLTVLARLRPDVSAAHAQASASVIFKRGVEGTVPPVLKPEDGPEVKLVSASRGLASMRTQFADPLLLLMAGAGIVLMIACANVATLMLARATARARETAVRLALGATRARIIRQLLTESLIVAALGGALGVLIAYWGASALVAFIFSNSFSPVQINVGPNPSVLGFTAAVSLLTGFIFGLGPAFRATRADLTPALKDASRVFWAGPSQVRKFWLGSGLVVLQVTLSSVLLVGALLLVRTLVKLATVNVGFDAHKLVLFNVKPELVGYNGKRLAGLYPELQRRLKALPGVVSVTYSVGFTLVSGEQRGAGFIFADPSKKSGSTNLCNVGPDFFETMRIPLLAGRSFNTRDFEAEPSDGHKAVVVSQTFARRYFAGENPLGQVVGFEGKKPPGLEIVGVVGDTKAFIRRTRIEPMMYTPVSSGHTFEVRTSLSPKSLMSMIRSAVNNLDSNLLIFDLRTESTQIDRTLFRDRLVTRLAGLFGLLAVVLACVGLYGLLSYEATRRTNEMGVRMALGAQRSDVLKLLVGKGIGLALAGLVLGMAAAVGIVRYLQTLLFDVKPTDPLSFATAAVLLIIVALIASYLPARRASKVDPTVALRNE